MGDRAWIVLACRWGVNVRRGHLWQHVHASRQAPRTGQCTPCAEVVGSERPASASRGGVNVGHSRIRTACCSVSSSAGFSAHAHLLPSVRLIRRALVSGQCTPCAEVVGSRDQPMLHRRGSMLVIPAYRVRGLDHQNHCRSPVNAKTLVADALLIKPHITQHATATCTGPNASHGQPLP